MPWIMIDKKVTFSQTLDFMIGNRLRFLEKTPIIT
jgi:hypothetical protein